MIRKIGNFFVDFYYWLLCHILPSYKWHKLDLRDQGEGYGYKYGFMDRDWLMYVACFKVLKSFVETEFPGYVDWEHTDEIKHVKSEILDLYQWWIKGRQQEETEIHQLMNDPENKFHGFKLISEHPNFQFFCKRMDEFEEKDNNQLDRLIRIRKYLWT